MSFASDPTGARRGCASAEGRASFRDVGSVLELWPHALSALTVLVALAASLHAMFAKREVRAAIGWVAVIWLTPLLGPLLYWLLGINRIRRRARESRAPAGLERRPVRDVGTLVQLTGSGAVAEIGRVLDRVGHLPRVEGNRVRPLLEAPRAYAEMVEAIAEARTSVAMASYIFEPHGPGARLVDALADAARRGVHVRVLVDDVGARYSRPAITTVLARRGVRAARFMRVWRPRFFPYWNLRNHRKLLVVDGAVGFTGGLNVREHFDPPDGSAPSARDLHFRLEGPVVAQLSEIFAEDWRFTTGESLPPELWRPAYATGAVGRTVARVIPDGPDEDFEKIRWAMLAAVGSARRSVQILTPYFLPDEGVTDLLHVAALRGVEVDVMIPERSNLALVDWAVAAELEHVLRHDVRVWLTPPPFDHGKLVVVDEEWVLLGSSNWDPRSLRLNFELNVECCDAELGAELAAVLLSRRARARLLTRRDLLSRGRARRVRDAAARLLSPYL
ncbi:MAG: phospholipase D-like domain-containing protein [Myxococcota bacterium]|nr:phospholipase D-like domain-containing protein [Myxococcota bacterium]MDW8363937.1 phospholipase D-like domain-containing protein [Myxococcales bacterium]